LENVVGRELQAVRIWPMSDKIEGFVGLSIEDVQRIYFLDKLPNGGGKFPYRASGLNAPGGTVVLFQFQARIIASGVFVRDERFEKAKKGQLGVLQFEADSIRTFEPVDVEGMRNAWPRFRGFGHVKQALNPAMYGAFKRRLKNVRVPEE
jgi:hypothetical protein